MRIRSHIVTTVVLLVAGSLHAVDRPSNTDEIAFAHIKSLVGQWQSNDADGSKSEVKYEVISGGSAVLEHFENSKMGPANAMATVYYLENGHLMLTHYCMAQNQPRMEAEAFDPSKGVLRFQFVSATGLKSPADGHMHNATFRFIDPDHFATDWEFFQNCKPKMTESVQYTRVH